VGPYLIDIFVGSPPIKVDHLFMETQAFAPIYSMAVVIKGYPVGQSASSTTH